MCSQKQHFEGVGEVGLGRERRGPEMQRAEVVLQGCPTWRQGQRPCTHWLGRSCPAQEHNSDEANPWD